jgi:hypothetical protein
MQWGGIPFTHLALLDEKRSAKLRKPGTSVATIAGHLISVKPGSVFMATMGKQSKHETGPEYSGPH